MAVAKDSDFTEESLSVENYDDGFPTNDDEILENLPSKNTVEAHENVKRGTLDKLRRFFSNDFAANEKKHVNKFSSIDHDSENPNKERESGTLERLRQFFSNDPTGELKMAKEKSSTVKLASKKTGSLKRLQSLFDIRKNPKPEQLDTSNIDSEVGEIVEIQKQN